VSKKFDTDESEAAGIIVHVKHADGTVKKVTADKAGAEIKRRNALAIVKSKKRG
jgi:hypothetical protein